MRTYVGTTGAVFGLLVAVHVYRVVEEGARIATNPWWILITAAAAALCLWAVSLLRREPK